MFALSIFRIDPKGGALIRVCQDVQEHLRHVQELQEHLQDVQEELQDHL